MAARLYPKKSFEDLMAKSLQSQDTKVLPKRCILSHRFLNKPKHHIPCTVDIIRKDASGKETSVPCYELYNHHYSGWMHGKAMQQRRAGHAFLKKMNLSTLTNKQHFASQQTFHDFACRPRKISSWTTWHSSATMGSCRGNHTHTEL